MAPRRKELSIEQKKIIGDLSGEVFSGIKIADMPDLKGRTVQNLLKRFKERGDIENTPRTGRQKKSSDRFQRTFRVLSGKTEGLLYLTSQLT